MVAQKAFLAALLASSSLVTASRWTVRDHYKYVDEHHDDEEHYDGGDHYGGDDSHHDSSDDYSEATIVAHSYHASKGAAVPDIYAAAVANPTISYSGVAPSIVSKAVVSAGGTYYSSDYSSYADVISKALASASGVIATNPSAAGSIVSAAIASASHVAVSNSSATITPASSSKAQITAIPVATKGSSTLSARNATTITAAPQTTVSLFNACAGPTSLCSSLIDLTYFGSVITADSSKAVYALDCSKRGRNGTTECFSRALTVTQGASVFARVDESGSIPKTVSCNIRSRTASAVCTESYRPTAAGAITASAAVPTASGNSSIVATAFNFASTEIYYNALVITRGAEKLNSNGTVATRTPSGPSSALPTAAAASGTSNAAGALAAPIASMGGIAAIVMAVFAL